MTRALIFLILSLASTAQAFDQPGSLDPAFKSIPFDQWIAEKEQPQFKWTADVSRPALSFYQRLIARVEVKFDGKELATRRGKGALVIFVQITDGQGLRYQDHDKIDLTKLQEEIKNSNVDFSQSAFVVPGDYELAVAILDTATGEHTAKRERFQIAPLKRDPLPDAWRGLPPVEFIPSEESSDTSFLPDVRGRLQWANTTKFPLNLHVILNIASSTPVPGARRAQGGNLNALIPALKAISQTGSPQVSVNVELLDLAQRRAVYQQDDVQDLDWPRIKNSLAGAKLGTVDVKALGNRHHDAQFFVSEVSRMLRNAEGTPAGSSGAGCVIVVLSNPVAFEPGEDLQPISIEGPPPNCRVIYMRYDAQPESHTDLRRSEGRGRRSRWDGGMTRASGGVQLDQLEPTLKPLNPMLFDVETPEQVRRAMAAILSNR